MASGPWNQALCRAPRSAQGPLGILSPSVPPARAPFLKYISLYKKSPSTNCKVWTLFGFWIWGLVGSLTGYWIIWKNYYILGVVIPLRAFVKESPSFRNTEILIVETIWSLGFASQICKSIRCQGNEHYGWNKIGRELIIGEVRWQIHKEMQIIQVGGDWNRSHFPSPRRQAAPLEWAQHNPAPVPEKSSQHRWWESSAFPSCPEYSLGFIMVFPKGRKLMSWASGKTERPEALCSNPGLDPDHLWSIGQAPRSLWGSVAQSLKAWSQVLLQVIQLWPCGPTSLSGSFSITCGVFPHPTFPTLMFSVSQTACPEPSPVPVRDK